MQTKTVFNTTAILLRENICRLFIREQWTEKQKSLFHHRPSVFLRPGNVTKVKTGKAADNGRHRTGTGTSVNRRWRCRLKATHSTSWRRGTSSSSHINTQSTTTTLWWPLHLTIITFYMHRGKKDPPTAGQEASMLTMMKCNQIAVIAIAVHCNNCNCSNNCCS